MKLKIYRVFFLLFMSSVLTAGSLWAATGGKIEVLLFYSPSCGSCIKLKNEFLPKILDKYKDKIEIKIYNTKEQANLVLFVSLAEQYNVDKASVPSIFIGNDFVVGRKDIEDNFELLIEKYSKRESILPAFLKSLRTKNLVEVFKNMSLLTIISGGLVDGINPCAFAVIVFFISFLSVYGYNKQEIIYVGTFYVLSVFITYILLGFGLFGVLYSMRHFYFLMKAFYYLIGAFCLFLAGFSFYDYLRYKRTKETDGMILQLPNFLKKRINLVIGSGLRQKRYKRVIELCLISFFVGFAVSLLEAACTGQIYLPIIIFVIKTSPSRLKAFIYLVVYNLMFVLPLIVIFILSLIGVSSKQFNMFLKNNLGKIKILMAVFFLILGIIMLWFG
ncbi:MAG: cytochrome c biogenesis protein CcdA [Candidatus Omnitrophota bacterium]